MLDLAGEYKTPEEIGKQLATSAATSAISILGAGAGSAVSGLSGFGGVLAKTGVSAATSVTSTVAVNAIQYAGDWDRFADSMKSFDTWQGCISSTVGSFVTNGLGELNLGAGNMKVDGFNTKQIDSIGKLNSLAGGLASTAVTFGLTGEATFNVLNIADFGANASSGLFEVTFGGKKGFSSRLGTGGTDFSFKNLKSAIAGYKEANKVTDWKYGSTETSSTLNSINMLGYTPSKDNLKLATDIWNEKLAVEYGNTGKDYGNYTLGQNKIVLSENLLGGGREASAKLATVMSHEGTHYNGKRVEALAHLAGADTYAQLNEMFKLQADTSFSMEMLSGIMNAESWKENTGSSDYWRVHEDGTVTWDGQLNFYKDGETDKNDAEAGKLLDYRNLDEVIKNAKKDGLKTVMLEGIEVDVERLEEIAISNEYIIDNSTYKNGKYTSFAAESLLSDGYMSYDEALKSEKDLANKYFWYLKLPDVVEHWSARYVLNQNDELAKTDWENNKYVPDDQSVEEFREKVKKGDITFSSNVELLGNGASVYHGKDCLKYLFKNDDSFGSSSESVLGAIHDISGNVTGYNFETRDNYMGTYNYGSGLYHLDLDMTPYWKWGNTPDDLFGSKTQGIEATPFLKRVHPYIQDTVDTYNKFLLEEKKYFESFYFQSRNYIY